MKTNRSHSTKRAPANRRLSLARLLGTLLFILLALVFVACGDKDTSSDTAASTGSSEPAASAGACLKKIQESGLTVAFDGVPPFSFVSASGGPVTGLIPDILHEFMRREGINDLNQLTMPFSAMIPALQAGKIDFNGTEISYTPERATQVGFTDRLYWNPDALVVKKGNPHDIHNLSDGKGFRFGTYSGSIYADFLSEAKKKYGFDLSLLPTSKEVLQGLSSGHLDAGMMDQVGAAYAISKNPGLGLELASDYTPASPRQAAAVHLAVRKECPDVAEAFNRAYAEMVSDGTRDSILSKWGLTPPEKYTEYSGG